MAPRPVLIGAIGPTGPAAAEDDAWELLAVAACVAAPDAGWRTIGAGCAAGCAGFGVLTEGAVGGADPSECLCPWETRAVPKTTAANRSRRAEKRRRRMDYSS